MEGLVSPSRGAGCTSLSIFQNDLDIWILGTEYLCKNVIPFEHQHPMFMVCVFSFCFSRLKHTSSLVWLYENRYPVLMHMLFKTALWYFCVLFFSFLLLCSFWSLSFCFTWHLQSLNFILFCSTFCFVSLFYLLISSLIYPFIGAVQYKSTQDHIHIYRCGQLSF